MTHFWSCIPHPLSSLFFSSSVVSVIGVCDTILYRAAVKAVLPNPMQPGAEFSRKATRKFSVQYLAGVKASLNPHADLLKDVKCKCEYLDYSGFFTLIEIFMLGKTCSTYLILKIIKFWLGVAFFFSVGHSI